MLRYSAMLLVVPLGWLGAQTRGNPASYPDWVPSSAVALTITSPDSASYLVSGKMLASFRRFGATPDSGISSVQQMFVARGKTRMYIDPAKIEMPVTVSVRNPMGTVSVEMEQGGHVIASGSGRSISIHRDSSSAVVMTTSPRLAP